jgi:hypothetical protein
VANRYLGGALLRLDRSREALPHLERAVGDHRFPQVAGEMGEGHFRLGEWEAALERYREAARREPSIASRFHEGIARCAMRLGRWGEASRELQRSVALAPSRAEPYRLLFMLWAFDLVEEPYGDRQALQFYERYRLLAPSAPAVAVMQAWAESRGLAGPSLVEPEEGHPDDRTLLGRLWLIEGDLKRAHEWLPEVAAEESDAEEGKAAEGEAEESDAAEGNAPEIDTAQGDAEEGEAPKVDPANDNSEANDAGKGGREE